MINCVQANEARIEQLESWIESNQKAHDFIEEKINEINKFNDEHNMTIHYLRTSVDVLSMIKHDLHTSIYYDKKELERLKRPLTSDRIYKI